MATIDQIIAWIKANPTATDSQIAAVAKESNTTAAQLAAAFGLPEAQVASRMAAAPAYVAPAPAPAPAPPPAPAPAAPAGPSYKDYTGSSNYLGKIIDQLNSGEAKVITSRSVPGFVSYGETDDNIPMFRPFATEEEGGGKARPLTPAEIAQARYNPTTERNELTVPVTVSPYIDLKTPINGLTQWPVSVAGNGAYKLSSMNNSETGYANVLFQPDASGKATITEANPVSFEKYDKGNFLSNFVGAAKDLLTSDAAKVLALGAGAMTFGPGLLGEAAAGGAGAGGAGAGGLTAFDAMGANMVTGALPGAGALGAVPSALDVMGADMVTGGMAGVAPTAATTGLLSPTLTTEIPREVIPAGSSTVTPVTVPPVTSAPSITSLLPTTVSGVIKALPLVPVVNQLVGDPLGLTPKPATPTPTASGFGQVPIPADWKSPIYQTTPQTPIDLEKIFGTANLLGNTQWKGLPTQTNLTFNDIFAAGKAKTPMGTPVNINQIVSAILGQNTASTKPA
jgi:hypothetical protein